MVSGAGFGAAATGAANLGGLIAGFAPTTQTGTFSGATNKRTQQTVFSDEATKRILDLMLQSTEGLQATASGERTAGLFDSTTQQLLINNMMAQIAGEVAMRGAPTEITEVLGPTETKTKTKKCFITTAICAAGGKADDCYELEVLRVFRDYWLDENHPEDIIKYYKEAPAIVAAIDAQEDAASIWETLRTHFIYPAIAAIEANNPVYAYRIYKDLFYEAKFLAGN